MALLACGVAAGLGFLVGPALMAWAFGPQFALAGQLLGPCLLIGGLIVAPSGYLQILVLRGRRWPGAIAGACGGLVLVAHWRQQSPFGAHMAPRLRLAWLGWRGL